MCLVSPCFICFQIWDEFRLAGAIQVSNQYPVCTFFSICTISPNLNGSGGSFLPQDFNLDMRTGQVINGNAFWDVSMPFWDHRCSQIFGREPVRLVPKDWVRQKMLQWKSSHPKPQDAAYIAYIQGSEKIAPNSNCHGNTPHGAAGVANRRYNVISGIRSSGKSPKNDETDLQKSTSI